MEKLFFIKNKHQAEALTVIQADMQCRQTGKERMADREERLQTDPTVDFPKHCILQYSIFKYRISLKVKPRLNCDRVEKSKGGHILARKWPVQRFRGWKDGEDGREMKKEIKTLRVCQWVDYTISNSGILNQTDKDRKTSNVFPKILRCYVECRYNTLCNIWKLN